MVLMIRSFTSELDLHRIVDLIKVCKEVDKLDQSVSIDVLPMELASPDIDPARDVRLWETTDGMLVGYGALWIGQGETLDGFLWPTAVYPDVRDSDLESHAR